MSIDELFAVIGVHPVVQEKVVFTTYNRFLDINIPVVMGSVLPAGVKRTGCVVDHIRDTATYNCIHIWIKNFCPNAIKVYLCPVYFAGTNEISGYRLFMLERKQQAA